MNIYREMKKKEAPFILLDIMYNSAIWNILNNMNYSFKSK